MNNDTPPITPLLRDPEDGLSADERTRLMQQLVDKLHALDALTGTPSMPQARLQLDIAESLNALERGAEAWDLAREAFITAMRNASWTDAVEACDVLYQSKQPDARAALGMGVWLAVTFPVDPELTAAMLIHVVDELPDDADDAAVAAITARYVVDLRADDAQHENLSFLTGHLLATVAQRHSNVQDQVALDRWLDRLQLREPQVFLPRLAGVVEDLVGDRWWFDRDALRATLPD